MADNNLSRNRELEASIEKDLYESAIKAKEAAKFNHSERIDKFHDFILDIKEDGLEHAHDKWQKLAENDKGLKVHMERTYNELKPKTKKQGREFEGIVAEEGMLFNIKWGRKKEVQKPPNKEAITKAIAENVGRVYADVVPIDKREEFKANNAGEFKDISEELYFNKTKPLGAGEATTEVAMFRDSIDRGVERLASHRVEGLKKGTLNQEVSPEMKQAATERVRNAKELQIITQTEKHQAFKEFVVDGVHELKKNPENPELVNTKELFNKLKDNLGNTNDPYLENNAKKWLDDVCVKGQDVYESTCEAVFKSRFKGLPEKDADLTAGEKQIFKEAEKLSKGVMPLTGLIGAEEIKCYREQFHEVKAKKEIQKEKNLQKKDRKDLVLERVEKSESLEFDERMLDADKDIDMDILHEYQTNQANSSENVSSQNLPKTPGQGMAG